MRKYWMLILFMLVVTLAGCGDPGIGQVELNEIILQHKDRAHELDNKTELYDYETGFSISRAKIMSNINEFSIDEKADNIGMFVYEFLEEINSMLEIMDDFEEGEFFVFGGLTYIIHYSEEALRIIKYHDLQDYDLIQTRIEKLELEISKKGNDTIYTTYTTIFDRRYSSISDESVRSISTNGSRFYIHFDLIDKYFWYIVVDIEKDEYYEMSSTRDQIRFNYYEKNNDTSYSLYFEEELLIRNQMTIYDGFKTVLKSDGYGCMFNMLYIEGWDAITGTVIVSGRNSRPLATLYNDGIEVGLPERTLYTPYAFSDNFFLGVSSEEDQMFVFNMEELGLLFTKYSIEELNAIYEYGIENYESYIDRYNVSFEYSEMYDRYYDILSDGEIDVQILKMLQD